MRDIGRAMSGGRDADVMVETADALAERFGDLHPRRQFAALHRRLAAHARTERVAGDLEAVAASLEAAVRRADGWPLEDCDRATLVAGEKRAFRTGRKALAAIGRDESDERWHEWRRRVKDLWYHHRLLANSWRGPMKAYADELDGLATLLGDDHALANLTDALTASDGVSAPPSVDTGWLVELITIRRSSRPPSLRLSELMGNEVERKFVLQKPPPDLESHAHERIEQG